MGHIVIYKGQSQYDVLRVFTDQLGEAFKSLGREVYNVDLLANNARQQLQEAFSQPCEFVLAFNAMGIDLQISGKSLYDALSIPFIAVLVDDPIYHRERLEQPVENLMIACVDRSHINFINSYYGSQRTCFFLPHGGCTVAGSNSISDEQPRPSRIDVLFGGSYQDPDSVRNIWASQNTSLTKLLDDIVDYILSRDFISLAVAAENVLASKSIYLSNELSNKLVSLLPLVDKYIRSYRRCECLRVLAGSGLRIDIYGSNWENARIKANNLIIHQPVGFLEMLGLMQQAKIVLNIGPNFPYGGHERVFSSMLNGAVTLTDINQFYLEEFNDGEDIVLYSWTKLRELPQKIYGLLDNQDKMEAIRLAGKRKTEEKHTWHVRAEKILDTVELFKLLRNIKVS
ncbi:hypothetical protein MTAT_09950 [Moorella thermoacetica]|uniref:Spore protein YkvP/CgeB glycosyl transferase-like domain-containing protein n=1 Tax=Neomoorella thermoacetica TaxID=1525 RepID=A0AAC9MU92_NEOTH|nr:glycosyltransferase [Moorella thermoacetica]AOQ23414.1 hypothetical protein Maut_00958 [Moorella thermoacetica]TYL13599.1 hypothetical protein MTAT_09950 [Moorella thermoacetica]